MVHLQEEEMEVEVSSGSTPGCSLDEGTISWIAPSETGKENSVNVKSTRGISSSNKLISNKSSVTRSPRSREIRLIENKQLVPSLTRCPALGIIGQRLAKRIE